MRHGRTARAWRLCGAALLIAIVLNCGTALAQLQKLPTDTSPAQSSAPEDALGRTTPRGTVLGFLSAARRGNYEVAAEYLNTRHRGIAAAQLARQLAFVLDRRLPARLNEISDDPEGSQSNVVGPGLELVGTILSLNGKVDVLLERVDRGKSQIWLFSSQTLATVPDLYDEVNAIGVETVVPDVLLQKVFGASVYSLLAFFIGLPLLYVLLSLVNRLLGSFIGWGLRRMRRSTIISSPSLIAPPIRLLVVAFAIHWSLTRVALPLLSRQFWASTSLVIAIIAVVWLFIMLSARGEARVLRHLARRSLTGTVALVRPARRVIDLIAVFVGLLFALYAVGVNPTAALAGLGVGGIAVALAAQKTLENVIGGASIIMDQAIRVGDFLKVGDIQGTVETIGLRSTRVRTLDRTVVSVPNGQMASMTLENYSFRDWYWFHHVIGLGYETTPSELSAMLGEMNTVLTQETRVINRDWLRVRLLGFGQSGFNVEVFAYVSAHDWPDFLEIQQSLLLRIMDVVEAGRGRISRPSQTIYLAHSADDHRPGITTLRKAAPGTT